MIAPSELVSSVRAVNLGCGSRYHLDWINFDLSASKGVHAWDVRAQLPLPSDSVDFVYSSHMLEHLDRASAKRLAEDVRRVLAPGGWFRVVVPDLARLARWYLEAFETKRTEPWKLEWARIHLIDQLTRRRSGGEMRSFLSASRGDSLQFAISRMGSEAESTAAQGVETSRLSQRLRAPGLWRRVSARARLEVARSLTRWLLGRSGVEALDVGRFAVSGEPHVWMYDSRSLSELLRAAGFEVAVERRPAESAWARWDAYNLDVDRDGRIYKPDSLYLEAQKPASPSVSPI